MQILNKIPATVSKDFAKEQYESSLYPLPDLVITHIKQVLNGARATVLFSGGYKLDLDATYIEPKMFSHVDVVWPDKTLFVDPSNTEILDYTIKKIVTSTLLILNSNIFIRYRTWQLIQQDIEKYKQYCPRVIVTMPVERFDFNRLKYTLDDIVKQLNGTLIDNTVIICQ